MRLLILAALAAPLAGCMTTDGMRMIKSDPPGALVTVEGYGTCETPCTVKIDSERLMTVAKAGYKARRFRLAPGDGSFKVKLELAAPTDDVDETALPDIQ